MKIKYGFLKIDVRLQQLLGVFYLASGIFGFVIEGLWLLALVLQFFLGIWQVLSGVLFALFNQDRSRIRYLLGVVGYFLLYGLGAAAIESKVINFTNGIEFFLLLVGIVIIPFFFAVWYFNISFQDFKDHKNNTRRDLNEYAEMKQILDSGELGKSN